ncbi:DUF2442 domain-containing protein [Caldicellulosiruptoraceae bacterium PP1]
MPLEYFPEVIQVIPTDNYKVYVYFDGKIKLFDVSSLIGKGEFKRLIDKDFYYNRCTVLNKTLAWDLKSKGSKPLLFFIENTLIFHSFIS